jgi:hypothetical protein
VEEAVQTFEPLVTEVHRASEAKAEPKHKPSLPAGLVRLREAGREAGNALLFGGLLAILSLVLALVLLLGPGKEADVVWPEEFQSVQSVLVEGP